MELSLSFSQLKLSPEIISNLATIGYNEMTPIQQAALPQLLEGHDLIAQAKTGSGKTAAFGLAILCDLDVKSFKTASLILTPTRELADQVCSELRKLARFTANIKILPIYGGVSEHFQERSLEHGAHIIVGTPGRVRKLLTKRAIHLSNLKSFVLDEADRMLQMGFQDDLEFIASHLPEKRQTMLFSATYPEEIEQLSAHIQTNAIVVKVDDKHNEGVIEQLFFDVGSHKNKTKGLLDLLGHYAPKSALIFCKTKLICDTLQKELHDAGVISLAIHGDLEQRDRTLILTKFSNQSCPILIATDVAARGLDIKNLDLVINYDLPIDPEVYTHRIGRTGRAGEQGRAISLTVPQEDEALNRIEDATGNKATISYLDDLGITTKYEFRPPMATIMVHGGKKDKMRPGDILGALLKDAGFAATDVGDIKIHDLYSFVAIKRSEASKAASLLSKGKIKGRKFYVEKV